MKRKYGERPLVIDKIALRPKEFSYVVYLPVKMPGSAIRVPHNLAWVMRLIERVVEFDQLGYYFFAEKYIYLTVKHMYVEDYSGNRPGWHSDGFMSNDLNYVWYDCSPTEFCIQPFTLSQDHNLSLVEMKKQARDGNIIKYPIETLLLLDEFVIHRVARSAARLRTFVKISVSSEKYNLEGNAHNHLFDYSWDMKSRKSERNETYA